MSNKKINTDAVCPFFCTESVKSVTCEGIVGENTVTRFTYSTEKVSHEEKYCTSCYESCPIYKANAVKY